MADSCYGLVNEKLYYAKLNFNLFKQKLELAEVAADFLEAECFLQSYFDYLDQTLWALALEMASRCGIDLAPENRADFSAQRLLDSIRSTLSGQQINSPEISRLEQVLADKNNPLSALGIFLPLAKSGRFRQQYPLTELKKNVNLIAVSNGVANSSCAINLDFLERMYQQAQQLLAEIRDSAEEY